MDGRTDVFFVLQYMRECTCIVSASLVLFSYATRDVFVLYRPIVCTGCLGHSTFEYPEVLVGPGQAE